MTAVLPGLTAVENVALPRDLDGVRPGLAHRAARAALTAATTGGLAALQRAARHRGTYLALTAGLVDDAADLWPSSSSAKVPAGSSPGREPPALARRRLE
jgi:hypothetical protein